MNITGGKYNSIKIVAPASKNVRPTLSKVRSGVFNVLASIMNFEDKNFLDCFGGSGIMSLEAISRGFEKVVIVEKDFKTAEIINNNFKKINKTPNLILNDISKALDLLEEAFDVIYIDPPYNNSNLYEITLNKIYDKSLLNNDGIIILECKSDGKSFVIPNFYKVLKEKKYGDTKIILLKCSADRED